MSMNDPRNNMGGGRDQARARSWSGWTIAAIVAVLLLAGWAIYSFSDRQTAMGPGDTTTGQSTRTAPAPTNPPPANPGGTQPQPAPKGQ